MLQEIYKDRKKFAKAVFEVSSSDLVNMGISIVSYTIKDISDSEVLFVLLYLVVCFATISIFDVICSYRKQLEKHWLRSFSHPGVTGHARVA